MSCGGSGYVGEFELHGDAAKCPGCPDCWSAEDYRTLHHAASIAVTVYDAVEEESGVPPDAPLYGKRDRLLELARRLDHEANHRPPTQQRADELLAWVEEQAEGAEHVAEKLKREGDDFDDRAYYEDAESFTAQANAYRAVAQQIERVRKGKSDG